ncbi:MAG: XRE family transcriptional regulator [Clostridia bacterium]|nr:XRE family transcriptional regulator [Clostridia bacterium]
MQQENEQKLTDGERLKKLKVGRRFTWDKLANDLQVSTSMLHSVMRGEKRLGRDVVNRLALIEAAEATAGSCAATPGVVREIAPEPYASKSELLGHIVWLEDQLNYARTKEERLLAMVESLASAIAGPKPEAQGRAQPEAPVAAPAARASGALYKSQRAKTA